MDDPVTKDINIKSETIDKVTDALKEFLYKIIGKPAEEVGLLAKDTVSFWRFKNQVSIFKKTQEICKNNKIDIKRVPLKILCPFIDNASLEESEEMQTVWARLLVNMIDSKANIQNHVFPYILSQLSIEEYNDIKNQYQNGSEKKEKIKLDLSEFIANKDQMVRDTQKLIDEIKVKLKEEKKYDDERLKLTVRHEEATLELHSYSYREWSMNYQIKSSIAYDESSLRRYEVANLVRLGLISLEFEVTAPKHTIDIPSHEDHLGGRSVDMDIEIEMEKNYVITELGELFVRSCT